MPYMIAVSLEMSDEPISFSILKIHTIHLTASKYTEPFS